MAEPAKNLSPEEQEYIRRLAEKSRSRRVFDGVQKPDPEYTPPDLQLIGDEDEEDENMLSETDDDQAENERENQPELNRDDIERLTKDQRIKETPEQQLEKNKVPEYKAEPPEAYKKPPGGPAIKSTGTAAKAEQGAAKAGQGAAKTAQGAAQGAKNTAQAAAKAGQAAVKAIQATVAGIRNAVAAIGALFSSAPAWVPVVLIILGILIIVGAVVIFLKARSTPNANGASPTIAADVIRDHSLIQTVLALSDQQKVQEILESNKQKLVQDLESFKSEIQKIPDDPRSASSLSKIDQVIVLINNYSQSDEQKAQEIKNLLSEITKPWIVETNPGGMIWPLGKGYRSITNDYRRSHAGIDVGVPIGIPLYAATSGKIVYLVDNLQNWGAKQSEYKTKKGYDQNGGFGNMIIVEIDNPIGEAKYWEAHHLSPGTVRKKIGDRLEQGEMFALTGHNGSSSRPHLHFGVCKRYIGTSCNSRNGGYSASVDPKIPLGWR